MYPKELIGKKAIRTAPVSYGTHTHFMTGEKSEVKDYSYTTEPLLIVNATDTHIIIKNVEESICHNPSKDRLHILNYRWIDNNWVDYDLTRR
ncbi:MAG: hypothetical protein WC373_17550 [Smithella sp.]|jgi:4-hydroxy-L-threonine phosphate dehydrogenase PdxA